MSPLSPHGHLFMSAYLYSCSMCMSINLYFTATATRIVRLFSIYCGIHRACHQRSGRIFQQGAKAT